MTSILDGYTDRAREELEQFASLHGEARGRLGGVEVKYAEALRALLAESASWPPLPQNSDWPTFAGSPARNAAYPQKIDVGKAAWRVALPQVAMPAPLSTTAGQAGAGLRLIAAHGIRSVIIR